MKKLCLNGSLPMLDMSLGFRVFLHVEDNMVCLYSVGHTIGLFVPGLDEILKVKITESTTSFQITGEDGANIASSNDWDVFLEGNASIGIHLVGPENVFLKPCKLVRDALKAAGFQIVGIPCVLSH